MLNHFNFKLWKQDKILLTNDMGKYIFLSKWDFYALLHNNLARDSKYYQMLRERGFILEPVEIYADKIKEQLRDMKNYILQGPVLHIFVVTNQCNFRCVYCQAQHHNSKHKGFMTLATGIKAINIALSSPNHRLSFEFQGGEPLLNFSVIKGMIEYTEAHKGDKEIDYTIVSNFTLLNEEIASYMLAHNVSICTSLDGAENLQKRNRIYDNPIGSYKPVVRGLNLLKKLGYRASAIQTTTRYSLPHAREIVKEYQKQGMHSLFIRPLTPLGFASEDWQKIGYTAEEFLQFYQECFAEILQLNRQGYFFKEQHATIFLQKILHGIATNYMELRSPCGAGVGQLAYYYDGNIYTCDEARMVAEAGNPAFQLGNVEENSLQELLQSKTCRAVCSASILETIPGCSDCIYQPYCGVCPVINLATYGNIFPKEPNSYRCRIYRGIQDYLFEMIEQNDYETMKILYSWIGDDSV